ncbi:MAG: DUF4111 domain-containing protein [Anaerolineae bacterium]
MITATSYPDINDLLNELLANVQVVLGNKLVGLYLYGSLVWGDFDHDTSDIDMLAATTADVDDDELEQLRLMHDAFAGRNPDWSDRIEVQYFSLDGLKHFREKASNMINISPGEPIHRIQAGIQWLTNWYFVQDYGITLYGPPPASFIPHIAKAEFIEAVHDHALDWREYVVHTKELPQYQAYAVLTLCRALYTTRNREQVSKKRAAEWAMEQLPEQAGLIQRAMVGRTEPHNNSMTYAETERFVHYVSELVDNS